MKRQSARTSSVGAAALLLLAFAGPARPDQPLGPKDSEKVVEGWLEQYKEAEQMLREGEWKKVRKKLDLQLSLMMRQLQAGPGSAGLLGVGIALRAVAEAGLGDYDDAAWDWNVARAFEPSVEGVDMKQFGAAGQFFGSEELSERTIAPLDWSRLPKASMDSEAPIEDGQVVDPPKKLSSMPPEYPRAKLLACTEAPILVRLVIDRDGRPRSPVWDGKQDAVLYFAAVEAIRRWRFAPARLDGKPIRAYYNLTINYRTFSDCAERR